MLIHYSSFPTARYGSGADLFLRSAGQTDRKTLRQTHLTALNRYIIINLTVLCISQNYMNLLY